MAATRLPTFTIPSAFIRLDSRVTDPDQYVNARDMQVVRNNQNKLLAQGIKRHLFTLMSGQIVVLIGANYLQTTRFRAVRPLDRRRGDMVFSVPVRLTPETQELEIVFSAYRLSASANCRIWVALDTVQQAGEFDGATVPIDIIATAAPTRYAATIPVGYEAAERGVAMVSAYMEGVVYGADIFGTSAIVTAVENRAITIDTTPSGGTVPSTANALYIDYPNTRPPKKVARVTSFGSNIYRIAVDEPFEYPITPGVDTVEMRAATGADIASVSCYEKRVTDFANNPGEV